MSKIQVATGRLIDVAELKPWDVELEDIATALSNICRFTGHVKSFYSVAQHCVLVSEFAEKSAKRFTNDNVENWPLFVAKRALLHDAHEAYIGDVSRPVKATFIDDFGYEDLVDAIDEAIFQRFGVMGSACGLRDVIDTADDRILATEKRDVLRHFDLEWPEKMLKPVDAVITPVGPEEARSMYVKRFNELWAKGVV